MWVSAPPIVVDGAALPHDSVKNSPEKGFSFVHFYFKSPSLFCQEDSQTKGRKTKGILPEVRRPPSAGAGAGGRQAVVLPDPVLHMDHGVL